MMVLSAPGCICKCTCQNSMKSRSITRADLVKNFPSSYTYAALLKHFSSEYFKIAGYHAEAVVIGTLASTFRTLWKVLKNKGTVYSSPRGKKWLETELTIKEPASEIPVVKTVTPQQKPRKPFQELAARGKKNRVAKLFNRKPEIEELTFVISKKTKQRLDFSTVDKRKKQNEVLSLFYDVNQGRKNYIKAARRHNWPYWHVVKKAKESVLYPKNIMYHDGRAEVSLADLMSHSTARILEYLYEKEPSVMAGLTEAEKMSLGLWAKVGGDGQGDHMHYSQRNTATGSGSSIFCISYVPLKLKAGDKLLWENSEPNSPLICMPLVFMFEKETEDLIQCEEGKLRAQIENLQDLSVSVVGHQAKFCLKANAVKVYSTMWDGKSCTAIAKTFLPREKKLASNTCHICLATPKDMNHADVWKRPLAIPEMIEYSCTAMHMWIRAMEFLVSMSVKTQLHNQFAGEDGQGKVPALTSKHGELIKGGIQARFWTFLSLRLYVVHAGHGGTSNNGNTARNFFKKDPVRTASILEIDVKIVNLFAMLLDMFNNPDTKPSSVEYEEKAKELFGLLTSPPLGKFSLSQSVHRFLCHGRQFIDCFEMPIGALSESALEARNKYNRRAREFHARKTSMKDNVHDVFNYLLCTSDAYMFLTRQ